MGGDRLLPAKQNWAALTGSFTGISTAKTGRSAWNNRKQGTSAEHAQKLFVKASPAAMVEAELAFGQMQDKEPARNAAELGKAALGASPKALYAVDMAPAFGKHVRAMIDNAVIIAHSGKAVVRRIAVGIDSCFLADKTTNERKQCPLFDIGNDLGIDRALAMENAKDYRLAASAATALASHPTSTEIALVKLNLAGIYAGTRRTRMNGTANSHEVTVDGHAADAGEQRRFCGIQVMGEILDELAKFRFGKTGTISVFITGLHKIKLHFFRRKREKYFHATKKTPEEKNKQPQPPQQEREAKSNARGKPVMAFCKTRL